MKIERPKSPSPLPSSAVKVFEGEIFSVYQWQQKMYDGSLATFEKVARPDTVVVVPVTRDGEVVIIHEEQPNTVPKTKVPTGRIEKGEDVEAAAARELLEETGYKAEYYTLWMSMQPLSKVEWAVYVLIGHNVEKVQEAALEVGEKIIPKLVSIDNFLELAASDELELYEIEVDVLRAKLDPDLMDHLKARFRTESI